jgi:hypothetical protein
MQQLLQQLEELQSHIQNVRQVIEKWYYITNINHFRLKYVRMKLHVSVTPQIVFFFEGI